ncbi:hypothetical protein CspHIS471_0212850 [Cutaneotrichosporon sp. HIS471]|nr:hypothetical protein CspHIS471_0212850 [Cutaneotrichosporon sp. HIS471]
MSEKATASDTTLTVVPIPPSLTPPSEAKCNPTSVEEQRKHLKESVRQLMEALITFDTALDSFEVGPALPDSPLLDLLPPPPTPVAPLKVEDEKPLPPSPPTSVELIVGLAALTLVIYIVWTFFSISLAITEKGMYLRFS